MPIAPLKKKYLGEVLLKDGLITKEQLGHALTEQQESKEKLGAILLKRGFITEDDLLRALAVCYGLTLVKTTDITVEEDVLKIIPEKMARRFTILPISKSENSLKVAMADPSNVAAIDEIEKTTNLKLSVLLSSEKDILESIERYYSGAFGGMKDLAEDVVEELPTEVDAQFSGDEAADADAAPIIKYVNSVLYEAVTKGASDIHLEPEENGVSLRMRLDGKLREFPPPPAKFFSAIVSRIKIIANLDIAERRLPQDGKCKVKISDKKIDVRVSTLPAVYGEKVVMRVLDRRSVSLDLDSLGFLPADAEKFTESLNKPYGMILVTGPTGSGKTTTLYTGLNLINTPDRNIVTAEDPVEYELKKINQVQVRPNIGLSFANVLRAVLRQDPDVIMVGEIRDKETAEIAIQSALTGHLVLSTLHTNSAVSSLSRLSYMGIEPFLIADAVDLVIAQRLMRRICPDCKEEYAAPDNIAEKLNLGAEKITLYHGRGCDRCYGTGYKGRTAITEVMKLSNEIRKMIIAEAGDLAIEEQAMKEGLHVLREAALDKLRAGITTVDEVLSVTIG